MNFFKGFTLNGFDIIFYINDDIYYKDGSYICSPRYIISSRDKNYRLDEMEFDALMLSGGVINKFYSSKYILSSNQKGELSFKDINETVSEEIVNLNGEKIKLQLSISENSKKNDIITFNRYDSLLRIKYNFLIEDFIKVYRFFKFCANRADISFDNVFIEIKNEEGKYVKVAELNVPSMSDNKINKEMLDYRVLKGHLNNAFIFLDNSRYIFTIIPNDEKNFGKFSNKDYCATFSCFESIYQYIHNNNNKEIESKEEMELNEVKKEIIPFLKELNQKYKGNNRIRRNFVKRFEDLVCNANLRLEKCITNELEKNEWILERVYYKTRNEIKEIGILNSVQKAVQVRDELTHNNIVKIDEISVGIYSLILILNYVMILEYIGVPKNIYEGKIRHLIDLNII